MEIHILAVGDVVGEPGLRHLERHLRPLQKLKDIAFTVVNGENASGVGLTPDQARRIYDAGADVVTLPTTPAALRAGAAGSSSATAFPSGSST